jgi:biopolymer transport protein ExbB/TolQ
MNIGNIPIRSGFFLLVTGSVVFWFLAGFLIFSLINNLARYLDTSLKRESEISGILNAIHKVQTNQPPGKKQYETDRLNGQLKYREYKLNQGYV